MPSRALKPEGQYVWVFVVRVIPSIVYIIPCTADRSVEEGTEYLKTRQVSQANGEFIMILLFAEE